MPVGKLRYLRAFSYPRLGELDPRRRNPHRAGGGSQQSGGLYTLALTPQSIWLPRSNVKGADHVQESGTVTSGDHSDRRTL